MSVLLLFAAAALQSAPAALPERSVCLLAGPSATLVAVELQLRDGAYAVAPLDGAVWPFAAAAVPLAPEPGRTGLQGRDEAGGLSVSLATEFADRGGVELHVARGNSPRESLPLLAGSCAPSGSAAAREYRQLAEAAEAAGRVTAETLRTGRLSASRHCHVVSSAGWVSRFAVEYHEDGRGMTIRPSDRHLWRAESVESTRLGLPLPSQPGWIRFAFGLTEDSSPDLRGSINSIWVYAMPGEDQSSAAASFFGHDPEGPVEKEDVVGICTDFAPAETGA